MTAVEKVDWFCPKCNSYVSSESVTFEETHQICNTGVILEPLNQNQMEKTAVEFLASVLSQAGQITKDDFDSLVKQAKEMEKEQEEQYNNMLSMLQETYRRLEHTDMISLRKQIKEVLTFKSK